MTAPVQDRVFEGLEFTACGVNVPQEEVLRHVRHAIRLGHPQVQPSAVKHDRIVLVGGGPSLATSLDQIRALVWDGAKLVTVNGTYRWCIDHGLQPSAQIVLDARQENARFVSPAVPKCRYYLASQCHPSTWKAVKGRPFVGIWHDAAAEGVQPILDQFYLGQWVGVGGGTTVGTRAIALLRMLGYLRFDLFGFDSCWMGDQHHAYVQPENDRDKRLRVTVAPVEGGVGRTFVCAPWHLKQSEDLLLLIRHAGDQFLLNVHGDGLLAFMLRASADVQVTLDQKE